MRHDWVFDVLRDLLAYARTNDLPALAAKVEATMAVAEAEVAALGDGQGFPPAANTSRPGRPH